MENVGSLIYKVESIEGAITCELNAQDTVASHIPTDIRVEIDTPKKKVAPNYEGITSKHAEREKCAAAVREEGGSGLEGWRRKLADVKHELTVIHSPILVLPNEITAEIFNWSMLMGGNLKTMLLVCKGWTTVAYSSPRLWSRVAVLDVIPPKFILQGALKCNTVDSLRSILSRSRASPLQLELYLNGDSTFDINKDSPQSSSLREAIGLILDNKVLTRCTYLVLRCYNIRFDYAGWPMVAQNMTILPLLSSLYIDAWLTESGFYTIRSLIKFSPSLRHIRWHGDVEGPEELDEWVCTKRFDDIGCLYWDKACHSLHESTSPRELGIHDRQAVAQTPPALQVLSWSLSTYSTLYLTTAPYLHTLIMHHIVFNERLSAGLITLPNLRVAIHAEISDITNIHAFQTPALEHLSIQFALGEMTALLELFDGSVHMPTPKSLHLDCRFTDAALVTVLGRLPWLEELQIASNVAQDAFWEGLTPSSKPTSRAYPPTSHPEERANPILVPNLKVLLVNYAIYNLYVPLITLSDYAGRMRLQRRDELEHERSGEWTVKQASAVAVAREQAGCPLETLACWSREKKVEVLIGSLDTLPHRPT